MIIDVHHHYRPQIYKEILSKYIQPKSGFDLQSGEYKSISDQLRDMDSEGIDRAILSVGTSEVDTLPVNAAVELASNSNIQLALDIKSHADRLSALAILPTQSVDGCLLLLKQSVEAGLKGAIVNAMTNGKTLGEPEFFPLFQKAVELDTTIFVHPTLTRPMSMFASTPAMAFPIALPSDTTLTWASMICNGVFEKLPKLKVIFAHMGGTLPFLIDRLDYSMKRSGRWSLPKTPSEYAKLANVDTVNFSDNSLLATDNLLGGKHILYGSDCPYLGMKDGVEYITNCNDTYHDYQNQTEWLGGVLHKNAEDLFKWE